MRVLVATDKFKGSLSALQAARAIMAGLEEGLPGVEVELCPMADGGEGTLEALVEATGARVIALEAAGPMPSQSVKASWAMLEPGDGVGSATFKAFADITSRTAIVEMAQASGFSLVNKSDMNPLVATTFGTGQLIKDAMDRGCKTVVVGIGGSATVDGGTGIARALGYRFLDESGRELPPGGGPLERLARIDASQRDERIAGTTFIAASDVDNPLLGEGGAARVFGPQKGATPEQVTTLERCLATLAERIRADLGIDVTRQSGLGAAGGAGAGLVAFCGARITSGVALVAAAVGLDERIAGADLVLTGEGRLDTQTLRGKTPAGVMQAALDRGVPVVLMAGAIKGDVESSLPPDAAAFSIIPGPIDVDEAMENATELLRSGAARLARLLVLLG